jgi:hypothetical protein
MDHCDSNRDARRVNPAGFLFMPPFSHQLFMAFADFIETLGTTIGLAFATATGAAALRSLTVLPLGLS